MFCSESLTGSCNELETEGKSIHFFPIAVPHFSCCFFSDRQSTRCRGLSGGRILINWRCRHRVARNLVAYSTWFFESSIRIRVSGKVGRDVTCSHTFLIHVPFPSQTIPLFRAVSMSLLQWRGTCNQPKQQRVSAFRPVEFNFPFVRVPPDVIPLQLCTTKAVGV
jgi:hypothetical protein